MANIFNYKYLIGKTDLVIKYEKQLNLTKKLYCRWSSPKKVFQLVKIGAQLSILYLATHKDCCTNISSDLRSIHTVNITAD